MERNFTWAFEKFSAMAEVGDPIGQQVCTYYACHNCTSTCLLVLVECQGILVGKCVCTSKLFLNNQSFCKHIAGYGRGVARGVWPTVRLFDGEGEIN